MFHSTRTALASAAVLCLSAGLALGQSSDQPSPPLGGPKVRESKIPGVNEKFGEAGKDPNARKDARGIPVEVIKRALGALDRDDTPSGARLTDAQRTRIESLVAAFRDSVDSYKAAHRSETEEVRRVLGHDGAEPGKARNKRKAGEDRPQPPSPPSGDQPAGMSDDPKKADAGDSEQVAAARAKLAELRANAPSAVDLQTQIWNELTDPQRAVVQAEVDRWIKEREQDRARDYVHKRLNKKGGASDRPGAAFDPENLPPKVKERLANMTPEEREKAIARFRERMKNSDKAGKRRADPGQGADKPAPSIDDVPVPSPDDSSDR